MKAMRRFLSLALTLAMVLSFFSGVSVASAEDGAFSLSAVIEDGQVRLDIIANEELKALAGVQFDIHRPEGVDMPSEDDDEAYVPYRRFSLLVSPEGVYADTTSSSGVTVPAGAVFLTIYFPDVCDNNYSIEVVDIQDADFTGVFEDLIGQTASVSLDTHEYGEPSYEWAEDNSSVTASRVCAKNDKHVDSETVTPAVITTKEATCEEAGEATYTATFTNPAFTAQTKTAEVPALGHAYGDPTYEWAEDNSSVTARSVCANDASHVIEETAKTSKEITKEATCEEAGEATYTATFKNEAFETQTKTAPIDPIGHKYGTPEYTWADDNSEVTAKTVCANDATHVIEETVKTTSEVTKQPTCEEKGETTFTATFTNTLFEAQTKTVADIDPIGHKYGAPEYTWADDNSEVTAKMVCENDPTHVIEETVKTTVETTKEATCEEAGEATYTATFKNEAFETQTKTAPVPALGHAYGEPEYTWADDNSEVTAKTVCANDATHVIEQTVKTTSEVTKEATCEDKGETTYTATFTDEHFKAQTKTVADIDPIGHKYGAPTYEWADDNSEVTAKMVCENDPTHVVEETVKTTVETIKAATCEEAGEATYTATFKNEAFETQTKTAPVPALGHAYGEPEYTWSDDNSEVTAKTVCANDATHVIEQTVKTEAKVTKEATCEEKGETTYTATFTDEHFTAQTKTVANIDALGHDYEEPKYEWADDNSSVKATTVCKRDASHTVEETVSTSYAVVTEPTLSEDGLGRYTATFTKEPFTVQTKDEVIPKLGQLITVTNYANGSKCIDAEGRELGGENLYYGEVTFTVESNENDHAIAVFLKEGDTLTRLTCTTAEGVHSFTITVKEPTEIVLGYKGDADLDGTVKTTDGTMIKRIALKSYTIEDPDADLKALLCDLNGDGTIKPTEGTMTSRAAMNNFQIDW